MAFTTQQQNAIDHDGHLLIVAGPGSGKTTTSVAKALRILKDPSRSLIMVTFTKEGAVEMRRRLDTAQEKAGGRPFDDDRLIISTFHSIAIRHLSRHTGKRKVLSPLQQGVLLQDSINAVGMDQDEQKEVRQHFESYMYAIDRSQVSFPERSMRVIEGYLTKLRSTGHTDLYTIMRDCALKVHDGSIPPMPYTDMLVDEGQDTDALQKTWIFAHARAGCSVTIVGDDDQSIYEWRQALGYEGMKSFMDTFKARRIELGDNFRCRQEILSHAVTLVQHNVNRLDKTLVARRGKGGGVAAIRTPGTDDQAQMLAELVEGTQEQHQNAVVLARKNRSLDVLEMQLRSRGIEYKRLGKSIWENPNIAGYLGFLHTLVDNSPVGVLGALRHLGIDESLKTELLSAMNGNAASFLDGNLPDLEHCTKEDKSRLSEFVKGSAYWRNQLRRGAAGSGSVREVVLEVGEVYAGWMRAKSTKSLVELCSRILGDMGGTLSTRLRFVQEKNHDLSKANLILMTMHGSKGLEFETVHIIDANLDDTDSMVVNFESERRLMYVALTRAKNRCVVWFSGDMHPTVKEAQIPLKHRMAEIKELVEKAG